MSVRQPTSHDHESGRSWHQVLGWVIAGGLSIVSAALLVRFVIVGGTPMEGAPIDALSGIFLGPVYAALGSLVVARAAGNRVGWLLIAVGIGLCFASLPAVVPEMATAIPEAAPGEVTFALWAVLAVQQSGWMMALLPLFLLLYVFPTGHLLSRRWMWAPTLTVIVFLAVAGVGSFGSRIGPIEGEWSVPNPASFIPIDGTNDIVFGLAWALSLLVLAVGGIVAIVKRYRRARDVERTQIRWVVFAAGIFITGFIVSLLAVIAADVADSSLLPSVAFMLGLLAIPVSITVAVLRYRLYDINIILSRSLTYGVLAAFITAVYAVIVVGVGSLAGGGDEPSLALSITAVAVVAVAFEPVRRRVQHWANRLVYGKRATPYEVLASFSHRATDESDEDVLARIPRLIVDGTGAAEAVVWVRSGDAFRAASAWPEAAVGRSLDGSQAFHDPVADVSLPVFQDGELLGGISLVAARGGAVTPPELELVESLADGLGLTLRNARLTAALRRQVKDLQRSRDRIVSAADAARRSLEHDLDSGPQQQLVAVKVKLGPIRKLAEGAGAVRTADLLADIEVQAGDAIQAVRDFAAGVYPPLLGAEGLSVALAQETRKAALPVDLEVDDVGRYPRDVESAVYFTILEALQNTAKYAEASHAAVRLIARNGDLRFEVSDDGRGFDAATIGRGAGLSGIADRIDTIGGTWTITSTPGEGTVVAGVVPVSDAVPV